jgi:hypothetical protein
MGFFDRFRGQPHTRVRMKVSTTDYIAGEQYDIPVELADQYIARGYADGDFSRHYAEDELHALRGNQQTVAF